MKIKAQDFKNYIQEQAKKLLKEDFEDDNLGIWTDFDSNEMMGPAKRAAMADMKKSGIHFDESGTSIRKSKKTCW